MSFANALHSQSLDDSIHRKMGYAATHVTESIATYANARELGEVPGIFNLYLIIARLV
jgi:hypothetical protein